MALIYIQQNGSLGKTIPYANKLYPNATIATGGCGCCSSLMVLLNSTKYPMTLKKWASILQKKGARNGVGTDMTVVMNILKKDYGFDGAWTSDLAKLRSHIKAGYKAVAHVGNKGYFSSGGHFVCIAGITENGKAIVLDPYYYTNKWTITVNGINRSKYFKYNSKTHEVLCDFSVIADDAKGLKYYLFKPTKKIQLKYDENDINYNKKHISSSKSNNKSEAKKEDNKSTVSSPVGANKTPIKAPYKKWKGYNTASTLNIRAKASTNGNIVGTLVKGAAVNIEGESGDFYKINYKDKTAYVAKKYISKTKPNESWTGKITASVLNVREKPSVNSKIIGTLKKGKKVTVLGSNGNFYIIKYKDKKAYVAQKYVKKK